MKNYSQGIKSYNCCEKSWLKLSNKRNKFMINIIQILNSVQEIGFCVKLHPYRQTTARLSKHTKLSPRFYGPYQVLLRIGQVAYQLQLPPDSRIHSVFHVSVSKKNWETLLVLYLLYLLCLLTWDVSTLRHPGDWNFGPAKEICKCSLNGKGYKLLWPVVNLSIILFYSLACWISLRTRKLSRGKEWWQHKNESVIWVMFRRVV